ncbi:glutamate racemase [Polluticaenibacter yanchengensis]|uniref:Glutamate racemase n=1 Tax=Polluticaenibacter yanchengensis TaxID=3014562 RepID=A0ABT4UJA9_9BACT|nr:glutamate racemase [Chitinophagaceae bacterium LY-5]
MDTQAHPHNSTYAPIGIFDSGYGGLTVFKSIKETLPQYDYIYLGDNARAPYGNRSFETIYQYTFQAVEWFFKQGCPLVILACNTASAKALRSIQQKKLPFMDNPDNRILGVIRPTTEILGTCTNTGHIGILGTHGTVQSNSYPIEMSKFWPGVTVHQLACPMWVPLIENNEHNTPGADYFINKYLDELLAADNKIDTILLACTHYPLIQEKIEKRVGPSIKILSQGDIVAQSLQQYLQRHPQMNARISKNSTLDFFTTEQPDNFNSKASLFFGNEVNASNVHFSSGY